MDHWPFRREPSPGELRGDPGGDIREEIELHLDLLAEELERAGLTPEAARREAERRFGDRSGVERRLAREARRRGGRSRGRWTMGELWQDVRYTMRGLARSRGFAAVAVLTIGIAVASNTAIFSVLDAAVLRALPFPDHDRLVFVEGYQLQDGQRAVRMASIPEFRDWRAGSRAIDPMVGYDVNTVTFSQPFGVAERVTMELVSEGYFGLLGARVALGRTFTAEEYATPDTYPVAVLSHGLWMRRFDGDPGVVGRTFEIDERTMEVVGVLEDGFAGAGLETELWVPLSMIGLVGSPELLESRGSRFLPVVGKLVPGATAAGAEAELDGIARELQALHPDTHEARFAQVILMREGYLGTTGRLLWILFGAGALLLLVAAANVANLLLARAHARAGELVVRRALGAGQRRLASQALVESLVLATLGGMLGLFLAVRGLGFIAAWIPEGVLPLYAVPSPSVRVFAFTLVVLLVVGVVAGVAPALAFGRGDLAGALRAARVTGTGSRAQRAFVVTQVGLALFLLVGAGLLARSFRAQLAVDPGMAVEGVHVFRVQPPRARYPDDVALGTFVDEILRRVREVPDVTTAAASSDFPFRGRSSGSYVARQDRPEDLVRYHRHAITPGYFQQLGVELREGRFLGREDDEPGAPLPVVVTQAFVDRVFPEEPAGPGLRFWVGNPSNPDNLAEVVGVVENVRYRDLTQDMMAEPNSPDVFFPLARVPSRTLEISYRVEGAARGTPGAVREVVRQLDPDVPVFEEGTLAEAYGRQTATPRFAALLMGLFGTIAVILACVGIYGVLAFAVGRRAREIAVRRALGARAVDVAGRVIGQGLALAALGIVVGGGAAVLAGGILERFLFHVEATDPRTLVTTVAVLLLVSAGAAALPAWRASRRSPVEALSAE